MDTTLTFNSKITRSDGLCQAELTRTPGAVAASDNGHVGKVPESLAHCLSKLQGGGVAAPLLDNYAISRRSPTSRLAWQSRRVRRFYQRYFTGVGVGGALRFLTLTSSDEAVALDYDIHRHFAALVKRLRRRWGRFEYMGVVEHKGGRKHLHLVFRGDYMAQAQVSAMWAQLHASPVVDIRAMWAQRGGVRELAKYLSYQAKNRYWASYNWVFRGWVGWSKRVRRAVGRYPSKALLLVLARLDKAQLGAALRWLGWRFGLALDNVIGVAYN